MADRNYISIPEARDELRRIAEDTGDERLKRLANLMYRRNHKGKRAPRTSNTITHQMREEIRSFLRSKPDASNQEVANYFGVNIGRVSEALEND